MSSDSYFQKLVVSVDGSPYSLQAEELAANLAKNFSSKVTLLHVVPHAIRHQSTRYYDLPTKLREEIESSFAQKGRGVVSQARAVFDQEGIKTDTILEEFADPAETILQVAREKKSDGLILGNRGTSEVKEFALGGVAEKVVRHAECPVLIVKKKTPFSKILVAVDGSKLSQKALEHAVQLAKKYGSQITLLNVAQTMLPQVRADTAKSMGERVVSEAESKVKGIKVDKRVELGHPAKTIIDVAKKGGYDVIALGSRGLSPVSRFFLGSVSDHVARDSECTVLIVR